MDDLALDAEILEHAFEQAGVLLERVLGDGIVANDVLRFAEEMQRRHLELRRADQRGLRLALDAGAWSRTRRRRLDAGRGVRAEAAHLCGGRQKARPIGVDVVIFHAEIVVDVDRVHGRGTVGNHGGEKFGLDAGATIGAEAGLGALGRFDTLGGAAPAGGAVSLVDLILVVAAEFRRGAAHERACRQPPVGDGTERQDAAVFVVLVVERLFLGLWFRPGRGEDGETVLAGVEAGAIGGKVKGRPDQKDRQKRGQEAGRIAAAGEDGRDLEHHVAEDAAEPGGQRPRLGRRCAAGDRSEEQRGAEPRGSAPGHIVDPARGGEKETPDHRRHEGGNGGETEELHRQIGKDGAWITHGVGDRSIGGVAEGGIGDVPGAEAGQPEGDECKQPDAGQTPRLGRRKA